MYLFVHFWNFYLLSSLTITKVNGQESRYGAIFNPRVEAEENYGPSPMGYSIVDDPIPTPNMSIISSPIRELHGDFIAEAFTILLQNGVWFLHEKGKRSPPLDFKYPNELKSIVDISLGEDGTSHDDLLGILENVIKYSPHPGHPYHLDKRAAGLNPYGVVGDWMAATMSNLLVTYLVSPVWTLMERVLIQKLCESVGWYSSFGNGVTTTGAGMANMLAINLAMQNKFPRFKKRGYYGIGSPPVAIFISEHGSSSFLQGARHGGMGVESIVKIKVDQYGRMDYQELKAAARKARDDGITPLMVVITAGTPILGAVDNIPDANQVCSEFKMWCHVDGEKGAGLVFSHQRHGILNGIQNTDSVTFGTWLLALPITTSFILTRNQTILDLAFGLHEPYVFTDLDLYDGSYDNGDRTIQTSRRPEVAKFWYAWKGMGQEGLSNHAHYALGLASDFIKAIKERNTALGEMGRYKAILETFDIPQVSFYFVPSDLLKLSATEDWVDKVSSVTKQIAALLILSGIAVVSVCSLPEFGHPTFFTIALTNSALAYPDLIYILKQIELASQRIGIGLPTNEPLTQENSEPYSKWRVEKKGLTLPEQSKPQNWHTSIDEGLHSELYSDAMELFLKEGLFFKRKQRPSNYRDPGQLFKEFDFSLDQYGISHKDIVEEFRSVINFSPHWSHPYFFYQLATGLDPYGYVADIYATALTTPMMTYQDSPVFTIMEQELLGKFRELVYGDHNGDGLITDGGSMSNQIAIVAAKQRMIEIYTSRGKEDLLKVRQWVMFISEDGHYSTKKGAIVQGYGSEQTIKVESTVMAHFHLTSLENEVKTAIERRQIPFLVVITTGTTIFGAIDPVNELIDICEKYQMWCHVDGMFGGPLVFSDTHRHKLAGIERSDSFGIDLHKMFGAPMVMSCIITNHPYTTFKEAFALNDPVDYDHKFTYDQSFDQGDRHWQSDKRNNMFKFWLMWKAKGRQGLGRHIDVIMDNVQYVMSELKRRDGFHPLIPEFEVTNVCFYFIPTSMRNLAIEGAAFNEAFKTVSIRIEKQLIENNVMNIVAQNRISNYATTPYFLKLVTMGSVLTKKDLNFILDAIEFYGKDLKADPTPQTKGRGDKIRTRFDPFGNDPDN